MHDASSSSSQNEIDYVEQEYGNLKRQYRIMEGDRNAYQQKAQHHISRQQRLIDRLRQEEEDLTTNLKLAQSNSVSKKDAANLGEIRNLSAAQGLYQEVVGNETNVVKALKEKIKSLEAEIYQQTQLNGSAISQHENHVGRLKKIRVLENRHNTSTVQYNKLLTENTRLRENIEHFRNQRKVFNTLYKRLTSKLSQQKAQIGQVIDSATCYYDQRDESLSKMISLRERNDQDLNHFVSEYKEMNRVIAHETHLQQFMNTKNNELSALALALENERSCGRAIKAEHVQEEEMVKFEKVLNAIVRVLNNEQGERLTQVLARTSPAFNKKQELCNAIQPVCERYRKTEEQNFSLFQFVNEISQDVKRLEDKISQTTSVGEREAKETKSELNHVRSHVGQMEDSLAANSRRADIMQRETITTQAEFTNLQSSLLKVFKNLGCNGAEIEERLNSSTEQVNMQTCDMYLSQIEQRINELTKWHNLNKVSEEDRAKEMQGKRPPKTPPSRQSRSQQVKKDAGGATPKKGHKGSSQNLQQTYEYMDSHYVDLEFALLGEDALRSRAQEIIADRQRAALATPKTPRNHTPKPGHKRE